MYKNDTSSTILVLLFYRDRLPRKIICSATFVRGATSGGTVCAERPDVKRSPPPKLTTNLPFSLYKRVRCGDDTSPRARSSREIICPRFVFRQIISQGKHKFGFRDITVITILSAFEAES